MPKKFEKKRKNSKKSILLPFLILFLLLNAGHALALLDKLEITAPESANVGELVTITVKANGNPVSEASVSIDAIPIGTTDSNGRIEYTFSIFGVYSITASKWGYLPSDIFVITVNNPLLLISADPPACNAGDSVTFTVTANLNPVQGVTVSSNGASIGTTDSSGHVTHTFAAAGSYSITAHKTGYTDAVPYTLVVTAITPLLLITADPPACNAGDSVTFTVTANLNPVQSVAVSSNGASIGTTNSNGQITHTFSTAGTYSITAHKTGYTDAVPYALIVTAITPLLIIAANPPACNAGDSVTFTVTANLNPVLGATVYSNGASIGTSDSSGHVTKTFTTAGTFSITAHKTGYTDTVPYSLVVTALTPLLVIEADPLVINAGDSITFTVTANLNPIQGVSVSSNSVSIGTTDSSGHVTKTFATAGTYSITAHKTGYTDAIPYSLIVTAVNPLLVITANPPAGTAGSSVTFTVTANFNNILGVTVYSNGASIGTTDSNGRITHTFTTAGTFSITAHKTGYTDALPYSLLVASLEPLLVITADPPACNAGDLVTFTITANLNPIQGVTVSSNGVSIGTTDSSGHATHTFATTGTYSITVQKTGYSGSIPYSMVVIDVHVFENVSFQGAIFPVPTSLSAALPTNAGLPFQMPYTSLILTKDKFFLVFSDKKLDGGLANVEGLNLINITWEGLSIGVVQAEKTSISNEGTQATIEEIKANPEKYSMKLVHLDVILQQCPFLIDIDVLRAPVTVGKVLKSSISSMDLSGLIEKIYTLNGNINRVHYDQIINSVGNGLPIIDFQTPGYWLDSPATVNAIVLNSGLVGEFVETLTGSSVKEVVIPNGEAIVLYNINTEPKSVTTTIQEINSAPDQYLGKVVTFEGSDLGVNVSIKKVLEHFGFPVPVDIILHGYVIWSRPAPTTITELQSATILSVGVSSIHQDQAVGLVNDALKVYRYTGKIVSAQQVNESFHGTLFVLYKREKIRDIPTQEISSEVQQRIQDIILDLKHLFQRQSPEIVTISVISPEVPGVVEVKKDNIENITIHLKNQAENISVSVLKFDSKPPEALTNVSGDVYSYLEIDTQNVIDSDVTNAVITFKVSKSWIAANNIDENSVKLHRYTDGNWSALSTHILSEDSTEVYYSADSPGFSIFAIAAEKVQQPVATVGTPGFEFLLTILALLAVVLYLRKKQ